MLIMHYKCYITIIKTINLLPTENCNWIKID